MKKNDLVLWAGKLGKLFSDVAGRSFAIVVFNSDTSNLWFIPLNELTFVKGDET